MELKNGYKQTDIGIIPEDWTLKSYGTIFNFLKTATYSRNEISDKDEVSYVHYGDLHTKLNNFLDMDKIDLPSISLMKAKKYSFLADGDVIIVDASEDYEGIGKSVEVINLRAKKAISGLHTFLLRDKNGNLKNGFKSYLHSNPLVRNQFDRLATGMKVFGVTKTNLKTVEIPLPSLPEQEVIAKVLGDVHALVFSFDELITKKRNIKQCVIQLLLTGKKRLPGFTAEWKTKTFSEIGKVIRGASPRPKGDPRYYGGEIPRLMVEDVTRDGKFVIPKVDFLTEAGAAKSRPCPAGTLTIVCSGTVGIPSILAVDACIHDGFLALIDVDKNVSIDYLYHQLSSIRDKFESSATHGGVFTNLTTDGIKEFSIPFPCFKEQNAIAEILTSMDDEIESIQIERNKYVAVKQGMMQELLTGKTRLV